MALDLLNQFYVSITIAFHGPSYVQGSSILFVTLDIVNRIELYVRNFLASTISIFRNLLVQEALIYSIGVLSRTSIAIYRYISCLDVAYCSKFFIKEGFRFACIDLLA